MDAVIFVLQRERTELYRRIDARALRMMECGLLAEVQGLVAQGFGSEHPGMNATGYRELVSHLRGGIELAEAVARMQNATRRYARRQLTWLRTQVGPAVHVLDAGIPAEQLADRVVGLWREAVS
jgi:tRNA dimethylallyltransferase